MKRRRTSEKEIRRKAERIASQMHNIGPLLKASLVSRKYKCGKENCSCAGGSLHTDLVVTRKVKGKTQTVKVRSGREKEAKEWLANWRRYKQLLDDLTAVEMELLRLPVAETRTD